MPPKKGKGKDKSSMESAVSTRSPDSESITVFFEECTERR
jgi:hypothetical protein